MAVSFYLVEEHFGVERRRVGAQRVVPHGAAEDEVEGVVGSLQLGGHVQHVLVARQRHRQRVARHDAVQRELRALSFARDADLQEASVSDCSVTCKAVV